ncbi:MAG: DNA polymerase IV [Cyanobacteria bacterium P01_D01_bin.44]
MTAIRKILHIDMDAFYASIEQRDCEAYRGKPLVVGGVPEKRGAVAAASYEARKYGIHSAMPSRVAVQRYRDLIFVKPRFEVYRSVSQQIRAIFLDYTDLVEPLSLDEAYLDVTQDKQGIGSAVTVAREIKRQIYQDTQLTASAGVSFNKFLAKTASDMDKPNGLYVILPDQAATFIESLPIEKFHGVGPATAAKMKGYGIATGADLRQWSEADLVEKFGKVGRHYFKVAYALDDRPVNPNRIRKSIGAERSFSEDLRDRTQMIAALHPIAEEVQSRLQKAQRVGYTLTLKLKYANYQQITRSRTLAYPLQTVDDILPIAQALLNTHLDPNRKVRLLGITLANLTEAASSRQYVQLALPGVAD